MLHTHPLTSPQHLSPGTTTITATAPGYSTVQDSITTIGPYPYSTTVYGFPSLLPADGGTYSAIMVQLQSSSGEPARAPNDVQVLLFSSELTIGSVTSVITIPAGQTYSIANFTSSLIEGNVTISAVGHGYKSTQTTITTQNVTASLPVEKLKIFKGPPEVLADNNGYKQIAVELQDVFGNIANATSDIIITVASADNTIATTDMQIIIPQNFSYALATVYSTYRPGTVVITAATNNIQIDKQPLTTVGYTPSKLAVYLAPSVLPSDNSTYRIIQVQLQDEQGRPARNPDSNTTVRLFSSNSAVGNITSEITIPFGQTKATGNFTVTYTPGVTTITAIGSNYTTGQTTLTTFLIDYLEITATATPQNIDSGNTTVITANVTADGTPTTGANVTFTSNNGGTFTTPIAEGNGTYTTTFTAANFTSISNCVITANATKTGYLSTQTTIQITVAPILMPTPSPSLTATPTPTPSPTLTATPTPAPSINTGTITLSIKDSQGNPLNDTSISSTTQPTGMQILFGITNSTGYVTFNNATAGSYTFNIIKQGYQPQNEKFDYNGQRLVRSISLSTSNTNDNNSGNNPIIIVAIAVIAIVIAIIVCIKLKIVEISRSDSI
jgi:hypothetical protein